MASNFENNFKTRAGIKPSEVALPYSITTDDVEKYLQDKFSILCNRMKNDPNYGIDINVDVKLYTTEAGQKFLPFVIILPMEVLKGQDSKKRNEPGIFNPKDNDKSAQLLKPVFELIKSYTFNSEDKKAFFSDNVRRQLGIPRQSSPTLASLCEPKVSSLDHGKVHCVLLMLDPIRVFHDMLTNDEDKRQFRVQIESWKKMRNGVYRYEIVRSVNGKKGKKYTDVYAEELNRRMRCGR